MHPNRYRRPRPRYGSLRRFPKPPSRLGGDRRLGRVHSRAFGTPLDLTYHLYVRGATSVCVYCVNCTKFGQLILRIIIKIDATRCQIFRPKCTKIVFGWGSAQWLKWFCEAGGSPDEARLEQTPYPFQPH